LPITGLYSGAAATGWPWGKENFGFGKYETLDLNSLEKSLRKRLWTFTYLHNIYIHTHTHTYTPWFHKCVIKTEGCGTSHKYTYVQIYSANIANIWHNSIISHLYTQANSPTQYKQYVCRCLLKAALKFALSLLRFVRLGGKLLNILMPA